MKSLKLSLSLFYTAILCIFSQVEGAINEAPEVHGLVHHNHTYKKLHDILDPAKGYLETLLDTVVYTGNETNYETLYNYCMVIAAQITTGRVVVTLPDGTVVIDTSKPTDFTDASPNIYANSYQHFRDKMVNENHNSRIAIFDANAWPYPWGVEIKYSTSDGNLQQYAATRLGSYLNSSGVIRLSIVLGPI